MQALDYNGSDRRYRVCHLVLSMNRGGLEMLIRNLVASGELARFQVMVCCLDEPGVMQAELEALGVPIHVLPRRGRSLLGLTREIARFFRQHKIDVLHTHSLDPMLVGSLAAFFARVPVRLHTQHNTFFLEYGRKDRLKLRVASWFCTNIAAISRQVGAGLIDLGVAKRKLKYVFNGIDPQKFVSEQRHVGGEFVFGAVGRLSPEKALDRLLRAFALIGKAQRARLLLVGDGPLRQELESLASSLGIAESVTFVGSQPDVAPWLNQMHALVNSSVSEGVPLAILEGMAAGRPIVATRVGGVPEIVDESCGLLIPPDDVDALASAMRSVMSDPSRCICLGQNGRRRVVERFTLATMARAYCRLYRQRLEESTASRWIKGAMRALVPSSLLLWKAKPKSPNVALTFDDGPEPDFTPRILNVLRERGAKATFFVVGENAERYPDVLKQIREQGHEVANHSFTHPFFDRISWNEAKREVTSTDSAIRKVSNGRVSFRPPRGKLCLKTLLIPWLSRKTVVMWSVDLKDYEANSPVEIIERLSEAGIKDGDIVLYHGMSEAALAALPMVVDAALAGGRRAVPVSGLVE